MSWIKKRLSPRTPSKLPSSSLGRTRGPRPLESRRASPTKDLPPSPATHPKHPQYFLSFNHNKRLRTQDGCLTSKTSSASTSAQPTSHCNGMRCFFLPASSSTQSATSLGRASWVSGSSAWIGLASEVQGPSIW